jgi:hypothetical protein
VDRQGRDKGNDRGIEAVKDRGKYRDRDIMRDREIWREREWMGTGRAREER